MTQTNDLHLTAAGVAALNRIADALEAHNALLFASQPERPAPNLQRRLEEYAGFDWSSIGARVEAFDRHGATEVTWNGKIFKRYRSNDDDEKGIDIRFRRVASGTVAEKNLKWESLIKFGGNRKPAKPLRGDLADKIEQQRNVPLGQHTASPNPPVATLGERMAAQPAPPATRIEIPADLRKDWLYWHDEAAKFGPVPAELGLYEADTIASVRDKIISITQLVEAGAAAAAQSLIDKLVMALADAKEAGVDVPPEFFETAGVAISVIEMRIGTINNLIAAKHNTQAPVTQQPAMVIDTAAVISELRGNAVKSAGRIMSKFMAADVVMALESIAGSKERRQAFTKIVFERESYAELSDAQRYALHAWLRPAKRNNAPMATNPRAAIELRAVLAAQPEGVPA